MEVLRAHAANGRDRRPASAHAQAVGGHEKKLWGERIGYRAQDRFNN